MIGDNIRNYRKASNMSQDELAEKLNVTRQSISLWENGQTQPSLENIIALSKLFNVSADDLLTNENGEKAVLPTEKPPKKKTGVLICILVILLIAVFAAAAVFAIKKLSPLVADQNESSGKSSSAVSAVSSKSEKKNTASAVSKKSTASKKTAASSKKTTAASSAAKKSSASTKTSSKAPTAVSSAAKKASAATSAPKQKDFFGLTKDFIFDNGEVNGDSCTYFKKANTYGGNSDEGFSISYWGSNDQISFVLHSTVDDTYCFNFYINIPKAFTGKYNYISSYNYIESGVSVIEADGTINAADFTRDYPLSCSKYIGDNGDRPDFMEISRQGICDLLDIIDNFLDTEDVGYSLSELGFKKY